MNHFTHCPVPDKGGRDCWREPHPGNTFGICVDHWREIVDQWMQDEPSITIRCSHCSRTTRVDRTELTFATCQECHHKISDAAELRAILEADAERDDLLHATDRPGVVYYMRFGERVKIGFTTKLYARAHQVPNDEVVAAEPGNLALERQRHTEFAAELVPGHVEWFHDSPRLGFHMANVRDRYGNPFTVREAERATARV